MRRFISADFPKLGVSHAFVIDEARLLEQRAARAAKSTTGI